MTSLHQNTSVFGNSAKTKIIIVQDSWNEDDDQELHEYLKSECLDYKIMSDSNILELDPTSIAIPFCDTAITQKLLGKLKNYKEIDTYPVNLIKFLKRDIKVIKALDMFSREITGDYNYFVKPISNDKNFNGSLICSDLERDVVFDKIDDPNKEIYFCREVKFFNEYRIFVGDNKVFGIVDCSDYLIDKKHIIKKEPPSEFIEDILNENKYKYCVIDVAMRSDDNECGEWSAKQPLWCLVEVNPPFALSSYDYPIAKYVDFCRKAWEHLTNI